MDKSSTKPPNEPRAFLDRLPHVLVPYAELMRIHRPLGFYLNSTPYFVGIAFSAAIAPTPIPTAALVHCTAILCWWSLCLRTGGCVWNDIVDLDLDRQISRTATRPLCRGAIPVSHAVLLTAALFSVGVLPLLLLPRPVKFYTAVIIFFALLYPVGKRVTNYPQMTLGNIGWAIPMSMHSLGLNPAAHLQPTVCIALFIATVIIMIDIVYSRQDTEEDLKVGVKNMAVRFRSFMSLLTYSLFYGSTTLLASAGLLSGLGLPFFIFSVGGHFWGFRNFLKATEVGKAAGVESSAKSSCLIASVFWVLGFVADRCFRV